MAIEWTAWKDEDDALDEPSQVETVTLTDALDDATLDKMLGDKLADVIDPPGIEQARLKFRQRSGPGTTIREALKHTRHFCQRFSPTTPEK